MEFRKSVASDIEGIMDVFNKAKVFMKEQGIDQWNKGYPNHESTENDIKNEVSYVLEEDNKIVGTVAAIFGGEKTYDVIYEGQWLSDEEYITVHRLAIDSKYKGQGLATTIFQNIETLCLKGDVYSIRVDTHEDNIPMQRLLERNGFKYCGIIYLADKNRRVAYEKLLK